VFVIGKAASLHFVGKKYAAAATHAIGLLRNWQQQTAQTHASTPAIHEILRRPASEPPSLEYRSLKLPPKKHKSVRIIIGTTTKVANAGRGEFFCPSCKQQANYSRLRASRFLTFFFIPIFPIRTIGEYLQCGNCQAELRPDVLAFSREQITKATAPWKCSACGNHNSYAEKTCVSCGAARKQGPPLLPGQSSADPVAAILSPPPLAGTAAPRKRGVIATILFVLGGCFAFFIALTIFAVIWGAFHPGRHSQSEPKKPGLYPYFAARPAIENRNVGAPAGPTAPETSAKPGQRSD
jgi:zinc-ribbon family